MKLFQNTASENDRSQSKSDADEVDDIERRLKHATLVHAASSDKALQVFDSSSNDTAVGLPPGLRGPGIFDKILSSEDLADQNDDNEAEEVKTLDTQFYTRILADNAASEDDVEQHIDDMISRPRVRSQDMTRERVDST